MRHLFTISLTLLSITTFCQTDTFYWRNGGDEKSINKYYVLKSKDTVSWVSIATVSKGKTLYYYVLPREQSYYMIEGRGADTFRTNPYFLVLPTNAAKITNAFINFTYLTWTVSGEQNVSYYLIQKSSDGVLWSQTTKITDKGNGNYSYRYTKTIKKYLYRVTPFYNDGTSGTIVNFR